MPNRKSVGRLIASAVLGVGLSAVGAVPAQAGGSLGGPVVVAGNVIGNVNVETKTVCKSVLVLAQSAPTVTVTIGGKPHVVGVDAFATADVKVCVQVALNADVRITANVDATNPLCPIVAGSVHVGAMATGGGIFVQVSGLDKSGKPLTISTDKLELLPAGAATEVPLLLVVCDP
jgi:hypothetical protein